MLKKKAFILFLLLVVLLVLSLYSQNRPGQSFVQQQILGGKGEGQEGEYIVVEKEKWTWPVSGYHFSRRLDIVYEAFPHHGALFSENSIITLAWQPLALAGVEDKPIRYEVYISSDFGQQHLRLRPGRAEPGKPTFVLFKPRDQGNYFWQVWAFFEDGRSIASPGRIFSVIP